MLSLVVGFVVGGALVVEVVVATVTVVGRLLTVRIMYKEMLARFSGTYVKLTLAKWHLPLPVAGRVTGYDRVAQHVKARQTGIKCLGAECCAVLGQGQQSVFHRRRRWAENGLASGRRTVPSLVNVAD